MSAVRFHPEALIILIICGSGSVVERHLAKVNVASSNLVFRLKQKTQIASFVIWCHRQVVRPRSETPLSPVQIWVAPLKHRLCRCFFLPFYKVERGTEQKIWLVVLKIFIKFKFFSDILGKLIKSCENC